MNDRFALFEFLTMDMGIFGPRSLGALHKPVSESA